MAINEQLLQRVKRHGDRITAQCPACAAAGMDKNGQHLRINGKGQFACVVHPGKAGRWHRKLIFQMVGVKEQQTEKPKIVWRLKR
jgi:hypothetical protein